MIMLGLGEDNVVRIPSDAEYRLSVTHLRDAVASDRANGFRAMAVIATVGTTSTASVDPVRAIADVCAETGAWLHVDAAYGGALSVLPEGRWVLDGVERADSVVVNPHKWLFVPLDFSVLYTRHPELLRAVFALTPEYLHGDSASAPTSVASSAAIDYMDYGVQLGRRFRALKAWMVFRAFGRAGIESRIREHCRLARLLAAWVRENRSFRLVAPVTMAVVCLRYEPADTAAEACDVLNEAIVAAINAAGDAYVTHTRLHGAVAIRVGFGNVLTTEPHVAHVWTRIQQEAAAARPRGPEAGSRRATTP
jgi:aromatic-L-amino-acid decarboxylase